MDEWWQVVLLGAIEGVTEFLPISSTAHLLLASRLLSFQHSRGGAFEIAIQFGAVLAVVGYYTRELRDQACSLRSDPLTRRLWLGIAVACLPAFVVGLALRDVIKAVLFASPIVIAGALIGGGIALLLVERRPGRAPTTGHLREVSLPQALTIGLVHALAVVPGVSRSGAAIVGGLLAGLDRRTATTFSFYLAIPTLGAATGLELVAVLRHVTPEEAAIVLLGTAVSLAVSRGSIGWLLGYVGSRSFIPFGIYRIALGLAVLGLSIAGLL